MNKVEITKEQAVVLEYIRKNIYSDSKIVEVHANHKSAWTDTAACLQKLSLDQMIKALYVGYEVKQTPNERIKECFEQCMDWTMKKYPTSNEGEIALFKAGIMTALKVFNINVPGLTKQ